MTKAFSVYFYWYNRYCGCGKGFLFTWRVTFNSSGLLGPTANKELRAAWLVVLLSPSHTVTGHFAPWSFSPQVVSPHILGRLAPFPRLFCLMSKSFCPMPKLFHPKCINGHLLLWKVVLKYSLLISQIFFMQVRIAARWFCDALTKGWLTLETSALLQFTTMTIYFISLELILLCIWKYFVIFTALINGLKMIQNGTKNCNLGAMLL